MARPAAAVVGAILALEAKDDLRAQALLDRVDLVAGDTPLANIRFAGAATRLRLATRRPDGAEDALKYAEDALTALADAQVHLASCRIQARCLISAERVLTLISNDRLDEAGSALAEALESFASAEVGAARDLLVGLQTFLCALRGDLSRAAELAARRLDEMGDRGMSSRGIAYCHLALAWIHAERSEHAAARTELTRAGELRTSQDALFWATGALVEERTRNRSVSQTRCGSWATTTHADPPVGSRLAAMRASMLIARGHAAAAKRMLAAVDTPTDEQRVQIARAMLALGERTDALECSRPITESATPAPLPALIDANLVLARAADETGETTLAARSLCRALRLSRPERIRRPFLEERGWLRRSIVYLINDPSRYAWLGHTVLGRQLTELNSGVPAPPPPLSPREQEVLRRLAEPLSAEEIATDMVLSANTLKTHMGSIYRKLGVPRRRMAIRRARELGIL